MKGTLRRRCSKVAMLVLFPVPLFGQGSPNITLLAQLDNYSSYASCWGYTAPDGREYALIGALSGTSIVDITDADDIRQISFISGASSSWRELKTYRHYAYVVNESGGGMQIISLANLPASATLAATYTGFSTAHTVYIDTAHAMLYAEGSSADPVRVISLANPIAPVQLTTFGIECHDMYVHNNRCYVAEGFQGTVGVYDVTNPATPSLIRRIGIPASGYVHNAWTTEDDRYLMTTEETSGKTVKMWDIQDLDNAFITDTYLGPSNLAHNVHIKGTLAFIAHYGDGLRIVDITNPANIFEIGYYDTHPGTTGFVGAWGVYPYYASDKVIISDISGGLFVFQFDDGSGSGQPPVVSDIPGQTVPLGGRFTAIRADNFVADPDHDDTDLTWSWTGNTNLIVTWDAIRRRIRIRTPRNWTGSETIVFTATDPDGLSDSDPATFTVTPVGPADSAIPDEGMTDAHPMLTSYPNPFNPATTISFSLAAPAVVSLRVYNLLGQEVAQLADGYYQAGTHTVLWNAAASSASGVYYARLFSGGSVQTHRLLFTK